MFHIRKLNNHINRIHERILRIVYQDHNSKFDELLAKNGSFKIHDRNLQQLLIEICNPLQPGISYLYPLKISEKVF